MNLLLRIFSFLYHLPLALFLFAVGAFSLLQGAYNLNIDMLPWAGKNLTYWLVGLGLFGLVSIFLAVQKKMRFLFALYALGILVLAFNGVFLSSHLYGSPQEFQWAVAFVAGALVALLGSFAHLKG